MRKNRKLRELAIISAGQSAPQGNNNYCCDGVPFIKAGNLVDLLGGKQEYEMKKVNESVAQAHGLKLYPAGTILFAKSGMSCVKGYVYQLKSPCYVVSHLACIMATGISGDYLKYYLEYHKPNSLIKDESYPSISLADIGEMSISYGSDMEQQKIVCTLNIIDKTIKQRKQQLEKLDLLVKSQFIKMFGDPNKNEKSLPTAPMTDVCVIIDGDRGANYPKQEDLSDNGYCLFLNAKNVTKNGFVFDECVYISKDKDKLLRNGKLSRGDIVLTTRGTIGNLAFYTNAIPFEHIRINSGMVILRVRSSILIEEFFIQQFRMQLEEIKQKIASGSAQPQLPITTMKKINLILPPLELQNQFACFVEQIEKSKSTIKQSLDKLTTLKNALMQKYFG